MRKLLLIALTLLCLVAAFPVLAEQYSFDAFHATVSLPDGCMKRC